jgi:tRNA-splicing ligase RtcB
MQQISKRLMNWASIIEANTLAQAETASTMPFIHPHLTLMPDAHLGKGATVGSVIPTIGAIMPAAVGVDIGCVDAATEYLSPEGWRRISDYPAYGGAVMQYDPATGAGEFVQPDGFVVKDYPELLRLRSKYGIDQMLSPDHRVLVWKITGRDRRRAPLVLTAAEFEAEHSRLSQGFKAEFETTFTPRIDGPGAPFTDDQLRVQVMVHADAHLERGRVAALHLKKDRKIRRARDLLDAAQIQWTQHVNADGSTGIRFNPPALTKTFAGEPWRSTPAQLKVIADEVFHWDGNADESCFYTRDADSANFMHYVFTATGHRSVMRADHGADGRIDYRVFAYENTRVSMMGVPKTAITREASPDGKGYCFTLPSGFWVMRRGGNIAMTGNCGMQAVQTQYHRDDLTGDLSVLREAIEHAIPLSAGKYNTELTATAKERVDRLSAKAEQAGFVPRDYAANWPMHLGSLGSGNHFIEVSVDERGMVWLFLHSGSRGIGNKIAQHHIKVAQNLAEKWFIQLPDKDLAYLVEGTDEFGAYIREMTWAQEFAWENRAEMMDRVVECFTDWHGPVERVQEVRCHHNYTTREKHFGKEVWLSRKGAIHADTGVMGLIPGSMGDASYVVEGKGNRLALNSAPHGAGRNYSRSAARRTFTHEELRKAMVGIEYRDTDAFIDEIPAAYKPIDQVMQDAADLVEVRHTLRQIVNVKGD